MGKDSQLIIDRRLYYLVGLEPELDNVKPKRILLSTYRVLNFLAQMALASLVSISGPKKVSIFRAHPFQ